MNDLHELLPFYALDALSDEEKTAVENYLSENPSAMPELAELQAGVEAIPDQFAPLVPSSTVKSQLMARINDLHVAKEIAPIAHLPAPERRSHTERVIVEEPTFWDRVRGFFGSPVVTGLSLAAAAIAIIWAFSLQGQLNSNQNRFAVSQDDLRRAETNLVSIELENDLLTQLLDDSEVEIEGLNTAIAEANEEVTTLSAELADLETLKVSIDSDKLALQDQIDSLETDLASAQSELETAESNLETTQTELDAAQTNLDTSQEDIAALEETTAELTEQIETANDEVATISAELETLESQEAILQNEKEALEAEIETVTDDLTTARAEVDNLNTQLTAANQEIETLAADLEIAQQNSSRQAALLSVYHSLDSQSFEVNGTPLREQAHGRFIIEPNSKAGVLNVRGLEKLSADQIYQLWLIESGSPVSAGLFHANDRGEGVLLINVADFDRFDAIGISIEPSGGSVTPSPSIIMEGPL